MNRKSIKEIKQQKGENRFTTKFILDFERQWDETVMLLNRNKKEVRHS